MGDLPPNQARVSSRALNPLSHDEDPRHTFCNRDQAKATTATRLFRDEEMLRALRELVIQPMLQRGHKREVHIWSAGCSSGEEPYSLAMVGTDEYRKAGLPTGIRVFGTDISHDQVAKARKATYLGGRPVGRYVEILKRYGQSEGAMVRIKDEIRTLVRCGVFDLRKTPKKHTFHFIVCNHVLQYYDTDAQLRILKNFSAVLRSGGYLFIEGLTGTTIEPAGLRQVPGYRQVFLPPQ